MKFISLIVWVTQFGVSLVFPTLAFTWLGFWLNGQSRIGPSGKPAPTGTTNYRQELILAVISRTLFWMWESPAFRAVSTLRMA